MTDYVQKKIAPGVELLAVPAGRFKTNELAIHLAVPMEEQMAANYALAISAVSRKGKAYPDMRALHLQLDKLYGAAISVVLAIIIMLITIVQMIVKKYWVNSND